MVNLHSYDEDISFHGFDAYIRKTWPNQCRSLKSFDTFVHYLLDGIHAENLYRDLFLARGFIVCLSMVLSDDTRTFSLDSCTWNMENRSDLFNTFCRYANIECSVIRGYAKAVDYKVGDGTMTEGGRHNWCAFRENNKWHLFDPHWCVSAVINFSHGNEVMLESDGVKSMEQLSGNAGQNISCFNEDWFCTSAEVFLIKHFPDESKWQLCDCPLSLNDWLNLPYLQTTFLKSKLQLLDKPSARLKTENGKCMVQIMADQGMAKQLVHSNRLLLSTTDPTNISSEDWPMLVLAGRDKNIFIFEIRLPLVGKYRFEIYFGTINDGKKLCCEFCILCDEVDQNLKKLPVDGGHCGFGFGCHAEDGGLSKPSLTGPILFSSDEAEEETLTFKVDKDAMAESEYGSFTYANGKMTSSVHQVNETRRLLEVNAKTETDDTEYGLVIGKRPKHSNVSFEPLLFYLVSKDQNPVYRERMISAQSQRIEILREQIKDEKEQKQTSLRNQKSQLLEAIRKLENQS